MTLYEMVKRTDRDEDEDARGWTVEEIEAAGYTEAEYDSAVKEYYKAKRIRKNAALKADPGYGKQAAYDSDDEGDTEYQGTEITHIDMRKAEAAAEKARKLNSYIG